MLKIRLKQHFYASWWLYLLVSSCFLLGLFFGFLGMNSLQENQVSMLTKYFEEGLVNFTQNFNFSVATRQAILKNIINLAKIFFMGLTILGLPLVLVIIFTRGFSLGFTLKFLLQEKTWRGGLLALLTVLPPNLLAVPAYFVGAVAAINFSFYLIKDAGLRKIKISQSFLEYLLLIFALLVLMLGSALIEGYFSPIFLKFFL